MDDAEARTRARQMADHMAVPGWEERTKATKIDRRKLHRVRPMEVLCLGLERTGTLSIRAALFELGYFDVYHMSAIVLENPKDTELWSDAYKAKYFNEGTFTKENWDQLLGHCSAVCDKPCAAFGPELIEAYPEAKVILTVRDTPESWRKSVLQTIYPFCQLMAPRVVRHPGNNPFYHLLKFLVPRDPVVAFLNLVCDAQRIDDVPEHGKQIYLEHNEAVRKMAPKGQFLEFNVKEGWKPLCEFLGKPIPDKPFPNINDTAEFKARVAKLRYIIPAVYVFNALKYLAVPALAVAGAYVYRGRVLGAR